MSGFTQAVKDAIRERDNHQCQRCWRYTPPGEGSVHHRRNRGRGGSSDPVTNSPQNLVLLCGTATTGCHGWVTEHPLSANTLGWSLKSWQDPASEPVFRGGAWWLVGDSWQRDPNQPVETWTPAEAPKENVT